VTETREVADRDIGGNSSRDIDRGRALTWQTETEAEIVVEK